VPGEKYSRQEGSPVRFLRAGFSFDSVDKITKENYNKNMSEEQKLNNEPEESTGPGNNDETGTRIYLSHDGLFRVFFDKKNVAESFIKENLPAEITRDLDVSHMPDEKIKGDVELRLVLTTFKYIFHPEILSRLKQIFQMFREFSDKTKFNENLELLLIYLWSNIKNFKFDQLQESVNDALEE
jgi:hypothetical protein